MTESEFQNFLKGLHIIDRKIVDIAYLSTPDEEERQKRFASLLKKAEQLQAHTEEIERLWNAAAAKVEEGRKERLKRAFAPFAPFAFQGLNSTFTLFTPWGIISLFSPFSLQAPRLFLFGGIFLGFVHFCFQKAVRIVYDFCLIFLI